MLSVYKLKSGCRAIVAIFNTFDKNTACACKHGQHIVNTSSPLFLFMHTGVCPSLSFFIVANFNASPTK